MTASPTLPTGLEEQLEQHRRPLTGYCYRMLGSWFEAEDAVQETMVRAWRSVDRLQSPEALKSWLYRIATNVCYDMLQGAQRRARPMDLASPETADAALPAPLAETAWVLPAPDDKLLPEGADPAELAATRETIRLAFVAALQHLPPKQRAVLILREVLRWQASEVAELLGTSVASVNSALQRARATLDAAGLEPDGPAEVDEAEQQELLQRYVSAFERYDMAELVTLLHDDAQFTMPPHPLWFVGPEESAKWMLGTGIGCKGSKVFPIRVGGGPGAATYKPAGPGVWEPFAIIALEMADGKITGLHHHLFPELFKAFGLPDRIEA